MKTPFVEGLQRAWGWCDRAVSRQIGHPFGADRPNAAHAAQTQIKPVRPAALRRPSFWGRKWRSIGRNVSGTTGAQALASWSRVRLWGVFLFYPLRSNLFFISVK